MTKIENDAILYFLQDHKLMEKELHEEFYDHIVSSFENRPDKTQDIYEHLKIVLEDLGQVSGIRKMIYLRKVAYNKLYRGKLWEHYLALFRWPLAVYTFVTSILVYQLTKVFPPDKFFIATLLIAGLYPTITHAISLWRYSKKCIQNGKAYTSKISDSAVSRPLSVIVFLIHSWNFQQAMDFDLNTTLNQNIFLTTAILMLVITFSAANYRLMSDELKTQFTIE